MLALRRAGLLIALGCAALTAGCGGADQPAGGLLADPTATTAGTDDGPGALTTTTLDTAAADAELESDLEQIDGLLDDLDAALVENEETD
jgi:hypothetical protein